MRDENLRKVRSQPSIRHTYTKEQADIMHKDCKDCSVGPYVVTTLSACLTYLNFRKTLLKCFQNDRSISTYVHHATKLEIKLP